MTSIAGCYRRCIHSNGPALLWSQHNCSTLSTQVAACDPSRNPQRKTAALFDLTDAGLFNMDIPTIKEVFRMLNIHYVERMGAMYFYNPPYLFWGLWNSLKGLLPEVTRSKIMVIDPAKPQELLDAVPPEVRDD